MSDEADFDQDDSDLEVEPSTTVSVSEEDVMGYSPTARELLRQQLRNEVEAYLARGGRISEIPSNVIADPPRKPQTNYGGQPI